MEKFQKLKKKLDNLEEKYKGFKEGTDYSVSVDKKGNKNYNIHSEELRRSIFGNCKEEGLISPHFWGEIGKDQPQQIASENTPNTPFWNAVWGEKNEFEFQPKTNFLEGNNSPKKRLLEGDSSETSDKKTCKKPTLGELKEKNSNSFDQRWVEVPQKSNYQKSFGQSKEKGMLSILVVTPFLFSLFFSNKG
jgi:hypothetical protein